MYGNYNGSLTELEFLRLYPSLKRFEIDSMHWTVPDLSALAHLPPDLHTLTLAVPSGQHGKDLLDRLHLRGLGIAEHKRLPDEVSLQTDVTWLHLSGVKDLTAVMPLENVEELGLASVTVPGLEALLPMRQTLTSLSIYTGGTSNVALLPAFTSLRYLNLVQIRGLSDLSWLAECTSLEHVRLEAMRNVTELPNLSGLTRLKEVELHAMKGIDDLTGIAAAPNLERFTMTHAMHLQPEVLRPLVGHPALREAWTGFGSRRKNDGAEELLGL